MTQVRHEQRAVPTTRESLDYALEWVVGIVGALAAAIATWMYYAETGQVTVFGWTWDLASIATGWMAGVMIGGGVLLSAAFAIAARRTFARDHEMTPAIVTMTVLAVLALAGGLTMGLIWLL